MSIGNGTSISELGTGIILKSNNAKHIKEAVFEVKNNNMYKENANILEQTLKMLVEQVKQ